MMNTPPKTPSAIALLILPLLLQGCSISTSEVAFGSGDKVRNSKGHGTGEVYGVTLEVLDAGGTELNANQASSAGMPVGGEAPEQGDTTTEVLFGKVPLTLVNSPSGDISLSVNGKAYGQLKPGDAVVVDERRNVKVNGAVREATKE